MIKTKVSARGQITIPKAVRQAHDIQPGDSILFVTHEDGLMLHTVTKTLFDLRGSVPVDGRQDFEAVLDEAKRLVAEDVVKEMENE